MTRTFDQHLFGPGPKRVLSLDGGGVRGVVTLAYLERIEAILRARTKDSKLVLADYFDLIGGTSTGAIIAAGLAQGWDVGKLRTLYRGLAAQVFQKGWMREFLDKVPLVGKAAALPFGLLWPKFPEGPLRDLLAKEYPGDLGGDALRTGLAVVCKRLDTGSPWVVTNNPKGKYFAPLPGQGTALRNRDFRLAEVVRASTAAPSYFEPEEIEVARRREDGSFVAGAFVDGGVSPFNNPALQMFWLATLRDYKFEWKTGPSSLLLVSVGTGAKAPGGLTAKQTIGMSAGELAFTSLLSLMDDCDALSRMTLQWLGVSPTAEEVDRELGTLDADAPSGQKLLTYLRYNLSLDPAWIREKLEPGLNVEELNQLHEMDRPGNLPLLERLAEKARDLQVREEHLPPAFDLKA